MPQRRIEEHIEELAVALEADPAKHSALIAELEPAPPKKRSRGLFDHYLHIDPCSQIRV